LVKLAALDTQRRPPGRSQPNCYHDDLRQQNDASYQYRKS